MEREAYISRWTRSLERYGYGKCRRNGRFGIRMDGRFWSTILFL